MKSSSNSQGLKCNYCGSRLYIKFIWEGAKTYSCKCFEYPEVAGILYLKKDKFAIKAVTSIRTNKIDRALIILLNLRLLLRFPIYFLYKTGLFKLLRFKLSLKTVALFSLDPKWVKYLLNREKSNYFQFSRNILNSINKKNLKLLDVGCGVGQLFENFQNLGSKWGIDESFLNLLIARLFFADELTTLICCNAEFGLPITGIKFDIIHMNDVYHYINNKSVTIEESSRLLRKNGLLVIVHSHKRKFGGGITGVSEKELIKNLKNSRFNSYVCLDDNEFEVVQRIGIIFQFGKLIKTSNNKQTAFSLIASKSKSFSFLNPITDKMDSAIFVSPHLDDAVLSSAGLIMFMKELGIKVKVVTIFTKASTPPYSPQGEDFVKMCGYEDAGKLFKARVKEDINVMRSLRVEWSHQDFVDAAFRKDENDLFLYKNSIDQFSGDVSMKDSKLISQITGVLEKNVNKNSLIFCPLGIGGHADHVVVRKAVEKLKIKKIFWEDYPYNLKKINVNNFFSKNNKYHFLFELEQLVSVKKEKAIRLYKTQMEALFPSQLIPGVNERYYFSLVNNE